MFDAHEEIRYHRHFYLPDFGRKGQEKLKQSSILIIGLGGLGSPLALYLCAMGIGTLGLVDHDRVELSNLQRQVIYTEKDLGRYKTQAMLDRLLERNSSLKCHIFTEELSKKNHHLLDDFDLIVDGTDNFEIRYLLNDLCYRKEKPLLMGAIEQWRGLCALFFPSKGPCYRCLFPEKPLPEEFPSCAFHGVLGVLPGLVSMIQSTEAVRFCAGLFPSSLGRVYKISTNPIEVKTLCLPSDEGCLLSHSSC